MSKIIEAIIGAAIVAGCIVVIVWADWMRRQPEPASVQPVPAADAVYAGLWETHLPKRSLHGTLSCRVHDNGDGTWSGSWSGSWQGQKFSYETVWAGGVHEMRGTAVIDGSGYAWKGQIRSDIFQGTFTSKPYDGVFHLVKQ